MNRSKQISFNYFDQITRCKRKWLMQLFCRWIIDRILLCLTAYFNWKLWWIWKKLLSKLLTYFSVQNYGVFECSCINDPNNNRIKVKFKHHEHYLWKIHLCFISTIHLLNQNGRCYWHPTRIYSNVIQMIKKWQFERG